jgi:hypothetical protein
VHEQNQNNKTKSKKNKKSITIEDDFGFEASQAYRVRRNTH